MCSAGVHSAWKVKLWNVYLGLWKMLVLIFLSGNSPPQIVLKVHRSWPRRCVCVPLCRSSRAIRAGVSVGMWAKSRSYADNFQVTSVNILRIIHFRTSKNCPSDNSNSTFNCMFDGQNPPCLFLCTQCNWGRLSKCLKLQFFIIALNWLDGLTKKKPYRTWVSQLRITKQCDSQFFKNYIIK